MTTLGLVSLVLAIGITGFWLAFLISTGFRQGMERWPGELLHERAFAIPDLLLATSLLVVAWHDPSTFAARLALACSGALLFLGVLDAGYLISTWTLRSPRERIRPVLVSLACILGATTILVLAL
jgi:hypothetical protein